MMKTTLRVLTLSMAMIGSSWAADADHIEVIDPYARAVPPTAPASAAFMTLKNTGDTDTALIRAESDVSQVTELHTHVHDNGVMRMRPVEKMDIPAHGETVLQPGGLHIMLINLKKPLQEGDEVTLTLTFADGSHKTVTAPVRMIHPGMKKGMMHGMQHDHAGHQGHMMHQDMAHTH